QDAHDERAHQRPQDAPPPAGQAGPAEDDGGDGVQLVAGAGGGLGRDQPGRQDQARQAGEKARRGVDQGLHPGHGNAGQAAGLLIAPHRVDEPPPPGPGEEDPEDQVGDQKDDHRNGEGAQVPAADEAVGRIPDQDGAPVGVDQGEAPGPGHGGEGDDEGGQVGVGDEEAVDEAQDCPHGQGRQDGPGQVAGGGQGSGGDGARQGED